MRQYPFTNDKGSPLLVKWEFTHESSYIATLAYNWYLISEILLMYVSLLFGNFFSLSKSLYVSIYCIAQNFGGGKLWQIWHNNRHLPIFYATKFQIHYSNYYCKFANIFLAKTLKRSIHQIFILPKFYLAKVLCYMVL